MDHVVGVLAAYHGAVESMARHVTLDETLRPATELLQDQLATPLGFHVSYVKMIAIFVLAYPLGLLLAAMKPMARHAVALVVGVVLAQFLMGPAWIHSLITTTLSYVLMAVLPRRVAAWGVFAVTLTYLIYAHYRRMIHTDLNDDFSSAQMVLTNRLSTLAFQLVDGAASPKPPKAETKTETKTETKAETKAETNSPVTRPLSRENEPGPLRKIPNPLEYFAFCYYFGAFIVGPAFHYDEYIKSVTGSKYRMTKDANGKLVRHKPGGRLFDALKKFVLAVAYLGYHVYFAPTHNIPMLVTPQVVDMPVLERFVYWWITLSVERAKYYFVWTMTEGACVAAGFGWMYKYAMPSGTDVASSNEDLVGSWDAVNNMDVWAFETAQSFRDASVSWNRLTSTWLKFTVFQRAPPSVRTVATYMVSAFWHGFYPGYYVFFITAALFQDLGSTLRSRVRPYFLKGAPYQNYKGVYDFLCVIIVPIMVNYLSTSFLLLHLPDIMTFWSSWYFAGHIAGIIVFIAVRFVPKLKSPTAAPAKPVSAALKEE